jgi:hypothetical protein
MSLFDLPYGFSPKEKKKKKGGKKKGKKPHGKMGLGYWARDNSYHGYCGHCMSDHQNYVGQKAKLPLLHVVGKLCYILI